MKLPLGLKQGPLSSDGLTGAGRSAFKMAHSHDCWQEASISFPCGPLHRIQHSHDNGSWLPPGVVIQRGTKRKSQCLL